MKITKRQLKRIIKEEKTKLLSEARQGGVGVGFAGWEANKTADFAKAYGTEARVVRNWAYNPPNPIAELGTSRVEDAVLQEGQAQEETLFDALDQYVMVLDEEMGYDVPREQLKAEVLNFVDGYFEQTEEPPGGWE